MTRHLRQVVRMWRPSARAGQRERDERDLAARIEHLEAVVEGLQDAIYRQAQQHDRDVGELRRRIDPAEVARALSENARRRGL